MYSSFFLSNQKSEISDTDEENFDEENYVHYEDLDNEPETENEHEINHEKVETNQNIERANLSEDSLKDSQKTIENVNHQLKSIENFPRLNNIHKSHLTFHSRSNSQSVQISRMENNSISNFKSSLKKSSSAISSLNILAKETESSISQSLELSARVFDTEILKEENYYSTKIPTDMESIIISISNFGNTDDNTELNHLNSINKFQISNENIIGSQLEKSERNIISRKRISNSNWDNLLNPELFTLTHEEPSHLNADILPISNNNSKSKNSMTIGQRIRLKYISLRKNFKHDKAKKENIKSSNLILPPEIWIYNIIPFFSSINDLFVLRLISKTFNENIMNLNIIWKSFIEERNRITMGSMSIFSNLKEESIFPIPSDELLQKDEQLLLKEFVKFKKSQTLTQKKQQKRKTKKSKKKQRKKLQKSNLQLFLNPIGNKRMYHSMLFGMFWCSCIFYFSFQMWAFSLLALPPIFLLIISSIKFTLKYWRKHAPVVLTGILLRIPLLFSATAFIGTTITFNYTTHGLWIVFIPLYFLWFFETFSLLGFWIYRVGIALRAPKILSIIINLLDSFCWLIYYICVTIILIIGWMPKDLGISNNWLFIPLGIIQLTQVFHSIILAIRLIRRDFIKRYIYPIYWIIFSTLWNCILVAQEIIYLAGYLNVSLAFMKAVFFVSTPLVFTLPFILTNSNNKTREEKYRFRALAHFFHVA